MDSKFPVIGPIIFHRWPLKLTIFYENYTPKSQAFITTTKSYVRNTDSCLCCLLFLFSLVFSLLRNVFIMRDFSTNYKMQKIKESRQSEYTEFLPSIGGLGWYTCDVELFLVLYITPHNLQLYGDEKIFSQVQYLPRPPPWHVAGSVLMAV